MCQVPHLLVTCPRVTTLGYMTAQTPADGPLVDGPHDPEHDPRASYALEPDDVAALTRRIVATSGRTSEVFSPINGQPVAHVPQSTRGRRRRGVRPRSSRAAVVGTHPAGRTGRGAASPARPGAGPAGRDPRPHLLGVGQGPQARVRRAGAHRPDGPLLRAHRREAPGLAPRARHRPGADAGRGPPSPQGRRRHHLAVELPVHDGAVRRPPRAARRQRRRRQARRAGHAVRAARRRSCSRRPACPPTSGRSWPARAPSSDPRWSSGADYVCFTGSTATGRIIAKQCAERLIGCSLELGGKNPILVLRDADIEKAAEGAVRASFSNAGQLCVSMERMYVADQVYDRFVERFVSRTEAMTLGAVARVGRRHGLADLPAAARGRHRARARTPSPRAPGS